MASEHEHDDFARRLKAQLDQSADDIDELTRAKLRAMRKRASARPSLPVWLRWGVPGAVAAAMAVALVLNLPQATTTALPDVPVAVESVLDAEDFDLIADADALSLDEDLEFYLWLHEQLGEG